MLKKVARHNSEEMIFDEDCDFRFLFHDRTVRRFSNPCISGKKLDSDEKRASNIYDVCDHASFSWFPSSRHDIQLRTKHMAPPGGATSKRLDRPKNCLVSYWWRRLEAPCVLSPAVRSEGTLGVSRHRKMRSMVS